MASDLPIGDVFKQPQWQLFTIMVLICRPKFETYLSAKVGNSSRIVADLCVSNSSEEVSVTPPSIH